MSDLNPNQTSSNEGHRPWLKSYPQGMKAEIDLHRFESLPEMIAFTCNQFKSKPAFSNMGHAISFSEVFEMSTHFASYLQNTLGLQPGERIVLQMPNVLQYPVILFGALRAGLTVVNANPLYTAHEMEKSFVDSGAVAIVALENFADKVQEVLPKTKIKHVILTSIGDAFPMVKRLVTNLGVKYLKKMVPAYSLPNAKWFRDGLSAGASQKFNEPKLTQKDIAFLQYTGGTTGVLKAAVLTHGNLLANQFQMLELMKTKLKEGEERVIAALPLYHVFCLTVNCFGLFHFGSHNILITNPKDIPGFVDTLDQVKPTVMIVVSTLAAGLLNNARFAELDFSALKISVAGGMALKSSVADNWKTKTKSLLVEGYGLTEASPVVSCNLMDERNRVGTIGLPLPSTEIEIRSDDGKALPIGESGELAIRGPQVMQGYWNKPEETEKVLDAKGWLLTGDVAALDAEGYLRIMDRKKDMILVSGFNVYPNEVEDVVLQHPKVLEAAAIGIPDEHSGEVVKLFVVKKDESLTEQELRDYCKEFLTAYKRPKAIEFRTELPKSNVGKVLRRELRDLAPAAKKAETHASA